MEKIAIILQKLHRRASRMLAQLASIPANLSWGLSKSELAEQTLFLPRYYQAIAAHKSQLPVLQPNDAQIVDELHQKGMVLASLDSLNLPDSQAFFQAAKQIARNLEEQATQIPHENNYEIHATKKQLIQHPEIFNFGLNPRLLQMVESYLGLPVAYDGVSCLLSIANGEEYGARAWHRDREDRRMIKVCIYLNDVDENGGPFQVLKPDCNDRVCGSIQQRYKSVYKQEMNSFFSDDRDRDRVSCVGSSGTVIFADTARFYHRGKPPIQKHRTAVFFSYFSRNPWHPFFCERFPLSPKEIDNLAPNLTPQQRDCVNWKKNLPKAVRWIPKSII